MVEEKFYARLEQLMRNDERQDTLIQELQRRMDGVEAMREDIQRIEYALTRLEGRLESILSRMQTWQTLVWALLIMLLGAVITSGFELLSK